MYGLGAFLGWGYRFRLVRRVTFSSRGKSNQKRFAPASGPALRSGFVTRFAHPSGQPPAVTPLRYVALHRHSRGTPRRAIPGPSRLSRHPCRSTPSATIPFTLLKGRMELPDSLVCFRGSGFSRDKASTIAGQPEALDASALGRRGLGRDTSP